MRLVSVRCRDLLEGQFVHSRTTGNLEATGSADVGFLGPSPSSLVHSQYAPATGHPSLEA